MARLTIRDLDNHVKRRLQERATRHGHSLDAEVRAILWTAVTVEPADPRPLGSRIAERFHSIGFDRNWPELPVRSARPASFQD